MPVLQIIRWLLILSSICGAFILTNKNRTGWWFSIINNFLWVVLWIFFWKDPVMVVVSGIYLCVAIRGLVKWKKI